MPVRCRFSVCPTMCDMRHDARLDLRLPRPCAKEGPACWGSGASYLGCGKARAASRNTRNPVRGARFPDCHQKFWMCLSSNGANRTAYRGFACTGRCRSALGRLKVVAPRSGAATSKTLMTRNPPAPPLGLTGCPARWLTPSVSIWNHEPMVLKLNGCVPV
jgi:hypothetical protein